jgi:HAD superfamily hydrolase (TIGR01458 family)
MMKDLGGLLIDLDGVLYIEDQIIPGARETVNGLRESGYPFRFLTNTTMKSRDTLVEKLSQMGIHAEPGEMFSTAVVAARWLAQEGLSRVQLLVHEDAQEDFRDFEITTEKPEAVVVGDLGEGFTHAVLNAAFLSIRAGARFVALQKNRFWQTKNGPALDAGAYVAALEYASETEAVLVGKPNRAYFEMAIEDMGLPASKVVMVGDDVHTDILGAGAVGAKTILVKTGKYHLDAVKPLPVRPDWLLDSIADLPRWLKNFS